MATDLPDRPRYSARQIEAESAARRQEIGLRGILGAGREKAMNIAFIVLIILVLMIGAVLLWYPDNSAGLTKKDVFGSALGLCTLILGYLFGRGR